MKSVKNFVFAVLLASVLAVSAPAGEVDGPGFERVILLEYLTAGLVSAGRTS